MSAFKTDKLHELQEKDKPVKTRHTIMIVDDEEYHLKTMVDLLKEYYHIITASDGQEALDFIRDMEHPENLSVIISDQRMPSLTGVKLFEKLKDILSNTFRIILTGFTDVPAIIDSINKAKIDGYIKKPFEPEELKLVMKRAVETFEQRQESDKYHNNLEQSLFPGPLKYREYFKKKIIAKSEKMQGIFKRIETIAGFNKPILITGETGTGKELIARAIHDIYTMEKGKNANFVAVNIAELNADLVSDTLFGHMKGAFSGADDKRPGLLEEAKDGTVFLDEIGALDRPIQQKLLRVLEEKEYYQLGSDKAKNVSARLVFATNEDLNAQVKEGKFRKDLLYRMKKLHIHLPPLHERKEDLRSLVEYFVEKVSADYNKEKNLRVPDRLIALLSHYDFPGNVRELLNLVESAVSSHKDGDEELQLDVFVEYLKEQNGEIDFSYAAVDVEHPGKEEKAVIFVGSFPKVKEMTKIYAEEALRLARTQQAAADLAGIDIKTLRKYLKGE